MIEQPNIPEHWSISRVKEYSIAYQLELLVDDINNGVFGEAAKSGKLNTYIQAIKAKYPKSA